MHVGERIGAYRKRRGMSQDALAGLIGMLCAPGCRRWNAASGASIASPL